MAQTNLTNQAQINGTYTEQPVSFSSNIVTTSIIDGLTVTKTADKTNLIDGPLTYTIEVKNSSGESLSSGTLTDTIETTLVDFNTTYGVLIDDTATQDFQYEDGVLTVTLPNIENDQTVTIKFQVTRKV